MKKIIYISLFMGLNLVFALNLYAGQVACFDADNAITFYDKSANEPQYEGRPDCLIVTLPPNTKTEYDAMKLLFEKTTRHYIRHDNGKIREMTAEEKSEFDSWKAAELKAAEDEKLFKEEARASAFEKLRGMGLTDLEIEALTNESSNE